MSNFFQPSQLVSTSRNERNHITFRRTDVDDKYNFKYIPVQHFKNMVIAVQRKKTKDQEEYSWASFVRRQWNNRSNEGESTTNLGDDATKCHDSGMNTMAQMSPDGSIEFCDNRARYIEEKLRMFQEDATHERAEKQGHGCTATNGNDNFITHRATVTNDTTNGLSPKIQYGRNLSSSDGEGSKSKKFCSSGRKRNGKYDNNEAIVGTSPNRFGHLPRPKLNISYDDNDEAEMIHPRPNPRATYKILTMLRKIVGILDEISQRLDNIPLPDGDRDLQRRQQRVSEFAIRFSRNYLYNLGRCVADLQGHIDTISSSGATKIYLNGRSFAAHVRAIEQKLIIAHQLLTHALTAYCKNIPSSVLKGHPGKLKDVLRIVTTLQDICDKMQLNLCYFGVGDTDASFLGKEIHKKCSSILAKLKLRPDCESRVARNVRSDIAFYKKRRSHRSTSSNRYSMYIEDEVASTCHRNKKLGDTHHGGNKRIIVHAVLNDSSQEHSNRRSLTHGSRRQVVALPNGRTINESQPREEDIETMMDVLPVNTDQNNRVEFRNECPTSERTEERVWEPMSENVHGVTLVRNAENLGKLHYTAISDIGAKVDRTFVTADDEQLSNLVPAIADLMLLMKQHNTNDSEVGPISPSSMCRILELIANTASNMPRVQASNLHVIASGGKNMQLSCVASEECSAHVPHSVDMSCQTNHENSEKRSENLDPIAREDGALLTLSNRTTSYIVRYRNEFQRVSQFDPMYTSNTQNKPWEIVSWISDSLVDELIGDIAHELEMDGVIQKLFDLEFQEF